MDDVFVYLVDLPHSVKEMVTPCLGGYTVYINARLNDEQQKKAYQHALKHIRNRDFEKECSVDVIEAMAHS